MLELFKIYQATTLATTRKYRLLGPFLGLLALLGSIIGAYYLGHHHGIKTGIDNYHNFCAAYGGWVVDETTGVVVQCKGAGVVPEQELKKNFQST